MTGVRALLHVAADRGDGRRFCGVQLLAWAVAGPVAAGLASAVVLCLGPVA